MSQSAFSDSNVTSLLLPKEATGDISNEYGKSRLFSAKVQPRTTNQLPRKMPRRVKGQFRKIGAVPHDGETGRVAVYCKYSEIDLNSIYTKNFQLPHDKNVPIGNKVTLKGISKTTASNNIEYDGNRGTLSDPTWIASVYFDVLHLQNGYAHSSSLDSGYQHDRQDDEIMDPPLYPDSSQKEVFIFTFGCVVFWNWNTSRDEQKFLNSLTQFSRQPFKKEVIDAASDDIDFFCGKMFRIRNDTVELSSNDPVERLAVSYAFAQSALLSVYEARLDETIERNEHIPVDLADQGKISMSQTQISQEIGKLFMERNSINLESDIIGTPDYFWEYDEWEPVYKKVAKYMEHEDRLDILNKRLDCVHELLEVLSTQVENQQASRLEWIIIWLIVVEVVVDVFWEVLIKDILGYFNH